MGVFQPGRLGRRRSRRGPPVRRNRRHRTRNCGLPRVILPRRLSFADPGIPAYRSRIPGAGRPPPRQGSGSGAPGLVPPDPVPSPTRRYRARTKDSSAAPLLCPFGSAAATIRKCMEGLVMIFFTSFSMPMFSVSVFPTMQRWSVCALPRRRARSGRASVVTAT